MQYFFHILLIPFLYFNYKIIISDLKYKKIPNKYLGYLLILIPLYYIYIFFQYPDINYLLFTFQIFITFLISFILYYFGIWAAGDAKYLLVLALFIPYIGIIPFIGNIALITLLYLFGYFIYFYLGKILFNKKYRQNLLINIKQDLNESWKIYKINKGGNTLKILTKFLIIFFIIFISIRLFRIYLFNSLFENGNNINLIQEITEKYHIYLIFIFIGLFFGLLILTKFIVHKIKFFLIKKFKLNLNIVGNILLGILSIFLVSFIIYEYLKNPYEIKIYLFRIFTFYLIIYIVFKILKYSYKITFGIAEYKYKNIQDLKEEDIVDKNDFNKKVLPNLDEELSTLDISDFKGEFNIVLNKNNIKKLKNIINIINEKDKKNYDGKSQIYGFNCLNTFSFGGYIFLGFIITFLYNNSIFNFIINNIILFIKNTIY